MYTIMGEEMSFFFHSTVFDHLDIIQKAIVKFLQIVVKPLKVNLANFVSQASPCKSIFYLNNKHMKKFLLVNFMLFGMVSFIWAQEKSLSGQIVGDDGSGLPGVNVVVKGTTTGTITDFDGNYRLSVPSDASTLVFTYIGYATQEVEIGARSVIDVTLSVDVTELQEVVVTAQGIQRKKEALGFAVSSVGADEVADKTEGDVVRSMRSKASGVQITQQSGLSGSGTNIIIRGYTSITGDNQPLFIVDGVPFNTGTNLSAGNEDP